VVHPDRLCGIRRVVETWRNGLGDREQARERDKAQASLSAFHQARFAAVDVRDNTAVQKMVTDCVREDGRLDYLFNNAGISQKNPYEASTLEDWKEMIDINLWGVIYGINAALPVMKAQKSGHIVNTSSVAALYGTPYQALYVATKSAVLGLTDCLYYEYLPENILFSVVCPGDVATPIFKGRVPEGAITAEEAARIILDGVEKKERMIVFPESMRDLVEKCKDRSSVTWHIKRPRRTAVLSLRRRNTRSFWRDRRNGGNSLLEEERDCHVHPRGMRRYDNE
jgi:NAD(P)-dependent dehydrogenase (short-subunit alcohol dehydrogenase family)